MLEAYPRPAMRFLLPLVLVVAIAAAVAVLSSGSGSGDGGAKSAKAKQADANPAAKPAAKPKPKIVSGPHDAPVPILMYHVVSAPQPGAPYPDLYTPKPVFEAQMKALSKRGYHGVTLAQVDDYWRHGYALPSKPIVISFDDGYLSHYTHALPVLKALGWHGVLNLEINNVRPGDLTASQVRALIDAGWEVDSHTISHPDLTTIGDAQLQQELAGSRRYLKKHFGVPADFFCYPAGRYDARVVAAVKAAGYRAATTTEPGLASPKLPFTLSRIRVDGQDGVGGLLTKLANPTAVPVGSGVG
jgi:peptidoglycan/xylan/chitin deacetylase (PgdA/CDA1 family)